MKRERERERASLLLFLNKNQEKKVLMFRVLEFKVYALRFRVFKR